MSGIASLNLFWILISDFNIVVSLNEFQGDSQIYYRHKARVYSDFIASNNYLEVNFTCSMFTWCNNQFKIARKWAWLDRCLLNSRRNALLTLILFSIFHFQKKKIFRFDNFLLKYISCHSAVREAWNFQAHSNSMRAFSHLIAHARSKLISWKISGLNSIETNLNMLELEIVEAEASEASNDSNGTSFRYLTSLYNNHLVLQRQNSTKWGSKSKTLVGLMW